MSGDFEAGLVLDELHHVDAEDFQNFYESRCMNVALTLEEVADLSGTHAGLAGKFALAKTFAI